LSQTNKMKVIFSSFYSNFLFEFLKFNFLLQFELWIYFQCLLNSKHRMTQKLSLSYDAYHCNIHTWLKFENFQSYFLFDVIFFHYLFKNSHENQFCTKISKILQSKEDMWFHLQKIYTFFHTHLILKWQ